VAEAVDRVCVAVLLVFLGVCIVDLVSFSSFRFTAARMESL
jgi:hypothetical protein